MSVLVARRQLFLLVLLLICLLLTPVVTHGFNFFPTRSSTGTAVKAGGPVSKIKTELLRKAEEVSRGLEASQEQQESILALIKSLEKKNPTKSPTSSALITARWRLVFTTSESILGKTRPAVFRPVGPIYQYINLARGTARNEEQIRPIPFLPAIEEAIDATIEPVSSQRVNVFFQRLFLGPLNFKFQSENYLDTTYLDKDMRISRGGRGNVFVLIRDDPPVGN
ncbi:hypothetical protein NSK_000010 [Nannochloropsis salina CCMP1776]|uniref:Plastid lipid-associated protein/fibrillin conserved domain-containing protein n=1 Tax=Nannochloropsis salina CCMP1776 TaxID=1027361 RepID=A0A4D9DAV1_9STRA|nr:hypothetical protein NSK_000010 [Nannochloropsis salina CCMP1776]|eukprot:TFJ88436.1 hypothetical protein NSK_000010 [Nannochloropsis salina CCMP1776]